MNNFLSRLQYWWSEGNYPLTKAMLIINVITVITVLAKLPLALWMAFVAPDSLLEPWRFFTYPLLSTDPIGLIFYGLMLWWVGGSLERSWGTRFFAMYFFAIAILTALGISLGAFLTQERNVWVGTWLPLSALVVAWCLLNPEQEIRLYGIIPVLAKWVAVGTMLIVFFSHWNVHPLMGLFALTGCIASVIWVRTRAWSDVHLYSSMPVQPKVYGAKPKRARRDDDFSLKDLNPIERIKRARRKKQFERLMKDD